MATLYKQFVVWNGKTQKRPIHFPSKLKSGSLVGWIKIDEVYYFVIRRGDCWEKFDQQSE